MKKKIFKKKLRRERKNVILNLITGKGCIWMKQTRMNMAVLTNIFIMLCYSISVRHRLSRNAEASLIMIIPLEVAEV